MLFSAFLLGIGGSLHCLGMCGPIVLSLHFPGSSVAGKIGSSFAYHLGRILTYSLMGAILGALSSVFSLWGYQQIFTITIGVLMLLFLVFPKIAPHFSPLQKFYQHVIHPIRKRFSHLLAPKTYSATFLMGLINGFLPCGLVSIALAGALASGTALLGAIFMALFGFGTSPLLWVLSFSQQLIPQTLRQNIQKFAPVMVGVLAFLLILRGLDLGIPFVSPHLSAGADGEIHSSCCHK